MAVAFDGQLSEPEPSQAEGNDAPLGKVDAAFLLILGCVSHGLMAEQVQNGGYAPSCFDWLIQQRGGRQTGHDLITQFAHAISVAFNHSNFLKAGGGVYPLGRPAVEGDIIKDVLTQA